MSRLSSEVRWWLGLLLALQILASFAAIGLLARVSIAVDRILRENESSVEAVESMLAVLASECGAISPRQQARFEEALFSAQANLTEDEEQPLLETVAALAPSVLEGQGPRDRLVTALQSLADVNRASMRQADQEARRIGGGGAWAAALTGLAGFCLGVLVLNRLLSRLVVPVLQVDAALEEARRGDPHRRCLPLVGPNEVVRIGVNLNWLLDERSRSGTSRSETADLLRLALLSFIDRERDPVVVVGPEGIVAMNAAAYGSVGQEASPAAAAAAVRAGAALPPGWTAVPLVEGRLWSCVQRTGP